MSTIFRSGPEGQTTKLVPTNRLAVDEMRLTGLLKRAAASSSPADDAATNALDPARQPARIRRRAPPRRRIQAPFAHPDARCS